LASVQLPGGGRAAGTAGRGWCAGKGAGGAKINPPTPPGGGPKGLFLFFFFPPPPPPPTFLGGEKKAENNKNGGEGGGSNSRQRDCYRTRTCRHDSRFRCKAILLHKDDTTLSDYAIIYNTLQKDPVTQKKKQLSIFTVSFRNAEPPDEATARDVIDKLFFSDKDMTLGEVGRYRINKKLGLNTEMNV